MSSVNCDPLLQYALSSTEDLSSTNNDLSPWPVGDFSFIRSFWDRKMLTNAYNAIDRLEKWEWLRTVDIPFGFTGLTDPVLDEITNEMAKEEVGRDHSGCSFGITMQNMRYIARHSFETFRLEYLASHPTT